MPLPALRRISLIAALGLSPLLAATPCRADEYARIGNVAIIAAQPVSGPGFVNGLMTMPSGWAPGGPAAVLIAEPRDGQQGMRDALAAELVGGGTAVLEFALPAEADAHLPLLFAALLELTQEAHAGQVVVLGTSAAGSLVLQAVAPGVAARHLGLASAHFALAAAMLPGCRFDPIALRIVAAAGGSGLVSVRAPVGSTPDCLHQVARVAD